MLCSRTGDDDEEGEGRREERGRDSEQQRMHRGCLNSHLLKQSVQTERRETGNDLHRSTLPSSVSMQNHRNEDARLTQQVFTSYSLKNNNNNNKGTDKKIHIHSIEMESINQNILKSAHGKMN